MPVPPHPLRILVVDDDPLILMNLVDMIEDMGHVVTPAATGQQALDELAEHAYDVVVTDHSMPGMSGLQLIKAVGAAYPSVAMVLATGYVDLPTDGLTNTFGRLLKPYSQADLKEALDLAVKSRLPGLPPLA